MKARVKNLEITCTPMTKFDYYDQILQIKIQHLENKRIKGYYCFWNGYEFWINEDIFNKLYTVTND